MAILADLTLELMSLLKVICVCGTVVYVSNLVRDLAKHVTISTKAFTICFSKGGKRL